MVQVDIDDTQGVTTRDGFMYTTFSGFRVADIVGVFIAVFLAVTIISMIVFFSGVPESMNAPPGSLRNVRDSRGDQALSSIQESPSLLNKRACYIKETRCSNPSNGKPRRCVGPDGQPMEPMAGTIDGTGYCCSFGCETEIPTYQQSCKSNQTVCNVNVKNQRVCVMDDNKVVVPDGMLLNGSACCQYGCFDPSSLPQRACFPEEVVCPGKSYCYNFSQEVTVPNAFNVNGDACCPQTGRKVCVDL